MENHTAIFAEMETNPVLKRAMERFADNRDWKGVPADEKAAFLAALCKSLNLNPMTQPFGFIEVRGVNREDPNRLIPYAKKAATDELRRANNISITVVERGVVEENIYRVVARATTPEGRTDEDIGIVELDNRSFRRVNDYMKAETKAKRRVTLSVCGLGMLDETEIETIPGAKREEELERAQADKARRTAEQEEDRHNQRERDNMKAELRNEMKRLGWDGARMKGEIAKRYELAPGEELTNEQMGEMLGVMGGMSTAGDESVEITPGDLPTTDAGMQNVCLDTANAAGMSPEYLDELAKQHCGATVAELDAERLLTLYDVLMETTGNAAIN